MDLILFQKIKKADPYDRKILFSTLKIGDHKQSKLDKIAD